LNHRHKDFQSSALPTELPGHRKQALDYSQFVALLATDAGQLRIYAHAALYNALMQAEFDAVVVGRGLVGMAAARALATEGFRVALVGPAPIVEPLTEDSDLRVYALSPGTVTMLQELKVWGALESKRVAAVKAMRVYSPRSAELVFDARDVTAESLNYVVEYCNLLQALDKALTFSSATFFNEKVVRVEQARYQSNRFASVVLASGLELKTKLILAADGVDSAIRGFANIAAERKDYGDIALVANIDVEIAHQGEAWQWFGDFGVVALLPMAGAHQMSLVWSGAVALADTSPELLGLELNRITQSALGKVAVVGQTKSFPLQWLKANELVGSRLALIGDAAHSMHPLAGQGLNLGFGDLAALLDLLKYRLAGQDIGDARFLRHYQRRRAEPVDAMLFVTDRLHGVFAKQASSLPDKVMRDIALAGWDQLARQNPVARQMRKLLTQHALV
jgi:2-polyprenylphenol 6-hydroxylase